METKLINYMRERRLIGSVRTQDFFTAKEVAVAMMHGGVRVFEVSITIPNWAEVVRRIQVDTENVVGVGALTDARQIKSAVEKGVRFISVPGVMPSLIRAIRNEKIPAIVGAFTPTEVFQALDASADMVEIFPANLAGGPDYVKRLRAHFPGIDMLVAGGIGLNNIQDYIAADATMVVIGEDIARPEWVEARDFESMQRQSAAVVKAVSGAG